MKPYALDTTVKASTKLGCLRSSACMTIMNVSGVTVCATECPGVSPMSHHSALLCAAVMASVFMPIARIVSPSHVVESTRSD